jgi:type II secretory pathway pseudopilin PulG
MQNNADEIKTQASTPRHLTRETGMSLIELLIGIVVTLGVLLAAFPIIDGAASTEGRVQQSAQSVGDARVFSDQVLRDLRPADQLVASSSTGLTVDTYVRHACGTSTTSAENAVADHCRVTYACSATTPATTPPTYGCSRLERAIPPGTSVGPAVTMVTGLSTDAVFDYPVTTCDFACYVGITLVLPNDQNTGGDAITLHDGTALRNVGA